MAQFVFDHAGEHSWQLTVVDAAIARGWRVFWIPDHLYKLAARELKRSRRSERVMSVPGWPDVVCVRVGSDGVGRCVVAELKSERGYPRSEQRAWLDALGRCPGIEAYLWRPRDLDEVLRVLV